eukprot:jgi/Pico_ML_1/52547/g3236.t1
MQRPQNPQCLARTGRSILHVVQYFDALESASLGMRGFASSRFKVPGSICTDFQKKYGSAANNPMKSNCSMV